MGLRMKILCGFSILTVMLFVAGIWSIYELTGEDGGTLLTNLT